MYLLIKAASGACNMRCRYCFYADEMACRSVAARPFMTAEQIDVIIGKALDRVCTFSDPRARTLSLGFQGGEPTLAGLGFFRAAVESVARRNVNNIPVSWFLQTNGTVIDEEWAEFLASNHFLVGLSLDGTPEMHDKNRITAAGKGTHSSVLRAARYLRQAGAEFNILTVLTGNNARSPEKLYNYYKKQGFVWQQFIPCIAPLEVTDNVSDNVCDNVSDNVCDNVCDNVSDGGGAASHALSAERYGDFLCRLFDLWYADIMAGKHVYNREFENWIGILAGIEPEDCGMRGICSEQYLIESDGSVYPCDFYALDEFFIGNVLTDSFDKIDENREKTGFVAGSTTLPSECRECRWAPLCRGGCRRNRDENGKNRFCDAYRRLFDHAAPRMVALADAVRGRR